MLRRAAFAILIALSPSLAGCCICDSAVKNFARFECRSKQSEAKGNLKALFVVEWNYFEAHGRYGTIEEVGFKPKGKKLRYQYVLVEATDTRLLAEARGIDEMDGDVWTMDEVGNLVAKNSVCGPVPSDAKPDAGPPPDGGVQHVRY